MLLAGVFEDRRLIIAVAQFDRTIQLDDTNEEITVEDVREKVHQLVSEACPDVTISCDDVLPLSGLWAYSARMLMSHPNGPEHSKYRRNAESYLRQYQSLPGGQGESQSSSLTSRNDDELVEQLLDVSRFASLEARYDYLPYFLWFCYPYVHLHTVLMVFVSAPDCQLYDRIYVCTYVYSYVGMFRHYILGQCSSLDTSCVLSPFG